MRRGRHVLRLILSFGLRPRLVCLHRFLLFSRGISVRVRRGFLGLRRSRDLIFVAARSRRCLFTCNLHGALTWRQGLVGGVGLRSPAPIRATERGARGAAHRAGACPDCALPRTRRRAEKEPRGEQLEM